MARCASQKKKNSQCTGRQPRSVCPATVKNNFISMKPGGGGGGGWGGEMGAALGESSYVSLQNNHIKTHKSGNLTSVSGVCGGEGGMSETEPRRLKYSSVVT